MNRQKIRVIALAALVVAAGAYVWAQRGVSTVKPAPTTNAATKKPGAVTPGAKPGVPAAKPGAPVANAKPAGAPVTPAATGAAPGTPANVPAKTPAAVPPAAAAVNAKAPAANMSAKPTAASVPVDAPVVPTAPVVPSSWQDQLQKGAFLAERLKLRLPEGTDLLVASTGFRDLQQFVATATASHNLKLNFEELKRRVITDGKGLAPAIDAMKKVSSSTIEEQRAEYEARGLIQEARRHPAPPAPAPKAATVKPQPKKPARTRSGAEAPLRTLSAHYIARFDSRSPRGQDSILISSTSKTSMPAGPPACPSYASDSGIQNRRFSPSTIIWTPSVQPAITPSSPKVAGAPRDTELSNIFPSVVHPV
jgi:hypothetical protein